MNASGRSLLGTFFHAPVRGEVEVLEEALVKVDGAGVIAAVSRPGTPDHDRLVREAEVAGQLDRLGPGRFVLPGFVDLHIHAPQYPQLGKALHVPLEVWLNAYTFPLEARYADLRFAEKAYSALVEDLLANGTTTALMFATAHVPATKLLADIAIEKGLRALVGKVAMDDPASCPDFYRDRSVAEAVDGTLAVIEHVRGHAGNRHGLVEAVVTPRFIPSCTDPLLEALGALARECRCAVQTHVSESDWEHGHVLARHGMTDTSSLDRFGLLGRRSVLAHGNHLGGTDMDLLAARGAGVAHCPLSNAYFANAAFPLRQALATGVRVGLGTDISGGPSASMFEAARMAVVASRMLEDGVDPSLPADRRGRPGSRIDWMTAFHLATAGGADALDLPVGLFEPGRRFDAMLVDLARPGASVRLFDEIDSPIDALAKILHGAGRADIAAVWVDGRRVSGALPRD